MILLLLDFMSLLSGHLRWTKFVDSLILLIVTVISSNHRSESVWINFRENYVVLFHFVVTHRIYIAKVSRLKITLSCVGRTSEEGRFDENETNLCCESMYRSANFIEPCESIWCESVRRICEYIKDRICNDGKFIVDEKHYSSFQWKFFTSVRTDA